MEDKQLNAAESIALISRMIDNTRNRMLRNSGRPFLVWGYVTVFTTLLVMGAVYYFQNPKWNILWMLLPVLDALLMWLTRDKHTEGKVSTFVDRVINNVWLVMGLTAWFVSMLSLFSQIRLPILFIILLTMGMGTTITGLIIRFRPATAGGTAAIVLAPVSLIVSGYWVDGKDVRKLTLESLRNQIGLVQQDVYLFCGSIRENIAYGKPDATMEEIEDAAKKANIHDFIMELPDGYETFVGERGTRLSGGQKQRISIARVFLKNPPILILDEATSALDNESERWIQQSLEELAKNRTTITIAHRLSTIRNADEILVVADNGIAERGTHDELIARGGIYAHYYEMS